MSSDLETRVRRANPMARQDQLNQIFGENESDRLLSDIHQGRVGRMTETIKDRTQSGPTPAARGRRGWLVAAGTAAITVLVVGTLLAITSIGDTETAAPPAGTDPVTVVVSAYEALNASDVEGWLQHFTDGAFDSPEQVAELHEVLAAAGQRQEFLEPCRLIGRAQVECTVRDVNDFQGEAGITITLREVFTVNEDSRIGNFDPTVLTFTPPGYFVFARAFWDWLRVAHPDVHAENRPTITTHWPEKPEQILVALDYLDEFLAQSDVYPVTDGS